MDKKTRKQLAILSAIKEAGGVSNTATLMQLLGSTGMDFSDRTVRLYLHEMDKQGLTESLGRKGRRITDRGLDELRGSQLNQRTSYLSAKIDSMTYKMDFDLATRAGKLVVNTSLVKTEDFAEHMDNICRVFTGGFAMGNRLALLSPGEAIGEMVVPDGYIGFCTVCSITLNGVLLKHGVPTTSRFGGLLKLRDGKGQQFVEMIHYDGTSIDPLEVFIRSGMTDYHGAIKDGNGLIGASFREMPADARDRIVHIAERLQEIGLGAFMEIGRRGQPLLGIPVSEGRIGAIVIGGLNPIAILEEKGRRVVSRALSGLLEYHRLIHVDELPRRFAEITS